MGRYPYVRQSNEHCMGPELPVGSRQWSWYCSNWPHLPWGGEGGLTVGQNRTKMTQNDSQWRQKPLWSLPTGLNILSMTHGVPMERFGPWETQHGAYHGQFAPFEAVFPNPNHISGSLWAKTMIWLYLGPCGSKSQFRRQFYQVQPPTLCGFHTLVLVAVSRRPP